MNLSTLARVVGKSVPYVITLQKKFELPARETYSGGHGVLLKKVLYLSICSIPVKQIKALLKSERRLLELLNADSLHERPDWFEALCTMRSGPTRLLLSGYDIGCELSDQTVQTGLNFSARDRELFEDHEMGANALVGLQLYTREQHDKKHPKIGYRRKDRTMIETHKLREEIRVLSGECPEGYPRNQFSDQGWLPKPFGDFAKTTRVLSFSSAERHG